MRRSVFLSQLRFLPHFLILLLLVLFNSSVLMKLESGGASRPQLNLFIAIGSKFENRDRRSEARTTWLNWRRIGVEYRFFTEINETDNQEKISYDEEVQLHQDIVLMRGIEKGRQMYAIRALYQIEWALEHFTFTHYLRTDDDIFLCLDRLLYELPYRPDKRFIWVKYWCWENFACPDENFMLISSDIAHFLFSSTQSTLLQMNPKSTFAVNVAFWVNFLNVTIFDDRSRIDSQQGLLTDWMHSRPPDNLHPQMIKEFRNFCSDFIYAHHVFPGIASLVYPHIKPTPSYHIPQMFPPSVACGKQLFFSSNSHPKAISPAPILSVCNCTLPNLQPTTSLSQHNTWPELIGMNQDASFTIGFHSPIKPAGVSMNTSCWPLEDVPLLPQELLKAANCYLNAHKDIVNMHDKRHLQFASVFERLGRVLNNTPAAMARTSAAELLIRAAVIYEAWGMPDLRLAWETVAMVPGAFCCLLIDA